MDEFPVRTFEDALLHALWLQRGGDGWWLLEVPIGYGELDDRADGRNRRIDAVVIHDVETRVSVQLADLDELAKTIKGARVEIIEAKKRLNFAVAGQILAGVPMFSSLYPTHGPITTTAVVEHARDGALRWFCHREGIEVVRVDPAWQ